MVAMKISVSSRRTGFGVWRALAGGREVAGDEAARRDRLVHRARGVDAGLGIDGFEPAVAAAVIEVPVGVDDGGNRLASVHARMPECASLCQGCRPVSTTARPPEPTRSTVLPSGLRWEASRPGSKERSGGNLPAPEGTTGRGAGATDLGQDDRDDDGTDHAACSSGTPMGRCRRPCESTAHGRTAGLLRIAGIHGD